MWSRIIGAVYHLGTPGSHPASIKSCTFSCVAVPKAMDQAAVYLTSAFRPWYNRSMRVMNTSKIAEICIEELMRSFGGSEGNTYQSRADLPLHMMKAVVFACKVSKVISLERGLREGTIRYQGNQLEGQRRTTAQIWLTWIRSLDLYPHCRMVAKTTDRDKI